MPPTPPPEDAARREPAPAAPRVELRLPLMRGELFGREVELSWLDACWEGGVQVAAIVAWGGVGKTSLVTKWLAGLRDNGWRGAEAVFVWSFYAQGTKQQGSSDLFVEAALRWFGDLDPSAGSGWEKGERLAALVRDRRTLLVLDGVEPLQSTTGVVGKLQDPALEALLNGLGWSAHRSLCVITSRLKVPDLEGMSGGRVVTRELDHLSPEAGAALLRDKGVKGTEEELREAAEEYKGHGLALTLLGSYLSEVVKGDIRRWREIGPLTEDETEGGHAQRVMAAYEPWIGGVELAILRMLGLFDRPATEGEFGALRKGPVIPGLTDALAGIGERSWNKAVSRLRKVGLLEAAQDHKLEAHPLVREHFGEQLRKVNEEAWREGHRRLYEYLEGSTKEFPETIQEMEPLYASILHGCCAGSRRDALFDIWWQRIRRGDDVFSIHRLGAFKSDLAALSAFFDPPWEQLASGLDGWGQAIVLKESGQTLVALGRSAEGKRLMKLALDQYLSDSNGWRASMVAAQLSDVYLLNGELDEALSYAEQSIHLAPASMFPGRHMINRTMLAACLHAQGRWEEAAAEFAGAERLQRDNHPTSPKLNRLWGFRYCDMLLDQGHADEVLTRATSALKLFESRYPRLDNALDNLSIGRAHLTAARSGAGGVLPSAALHLNTAVDGLRNSGYETRLPLGLLARAALHLHNRDFDLARKDLAESLSLSKRCGFRLHLADTHLADARLLLAEGKPEEARGHLGEARRLIHETGYHRRDEELAELERKTARAPGTQGTERKRTGAERGESLPEDASSAPDAAAPLLLSPLPLAPLAPLAVSSSSSAPEPTQPSSPPSIAMTTPTALQAVDIGIVIALPEELRVFLDLAQPYEPHPDPDLSTYLFNRGKYRCAVTLAGGMGEVQAAVFTERLIGALDPGIIVSIGIAGGLNDLRAGDVHIPDQAVQYIQDSKAEPAELGAFAIVPGAQAYRADFALFQAVRNLEFRHAKAHKGWVDACAADFVELLKDDAKRVALVSSERVRVGVLALTDGHVATGPVVGAAKAFSAWVRSHDRQIKSIEMESAAVLLAAQNRRYRKRAIAIRAISDFGDEHKKDLDKEGDGVLRRYAMRNAVRLLWTLLDVEAFPQDPR